MNETLQSSRPLSYVAVVTSSHLCTLFLILTLNGEETSAKVQQNYTAQRHMLQ